MKKKLLTLILLFTLLFTLSAAPLWLDRDTSAALANKETRIDIYNTGAKTNSLTFLEGNVKHDTPGWMNNPTWLKNSGQGTLLISKAKLKNKRGYTKFKVNGNGVLRIEFKGPWVLRDTANKNKGIKELYITYKDVLFKGKQIFNQKTVWHNAPFVYTAPVKDGEIITLNYKAKKHLSLSGVDIYLLIITLTLSFLLAYKIVPYIARFKIEDHISRIDIVFVCCFFILLFIPMFKISQEEKDLQENRMLATYQPIFKDGKINTEYGKQFEAWFNDRFNGRKKLILLNNLVQLYSFPEIYKNTKAVYLRKSGWMFNLPLYAGVPNKDQTKRIIENLKKLEKWCSDRNIKFYLLIVPYKNALYPEYLVPLKYDSQQTTHHKQFIKHLQMEIGNGIVIYPYEELLQAKAKDFIFFKESHHWTDWGAFIGYQKLMKRITKDFPDINTVSLEDYKTHTSTLIRDDYGRDYNTGPTTKLLGISPDFAKKYILKNKYTYYDNKDEKNLTEKRGQYIKEFNYPKGKYRILLTGTSQNGNLIQFLPYSAKQLKYIHWNAGQLPAIEEGKMMHYYQKDIEDFHPDMMIVSIVAYSNIFKLLDMWKD